MTREEALQLLKKAEELRDQATEIIDHVVEAAPYGEFHDLYNLIFLEFWSAEDAMNLSRIYGE